MSETRTEETRLTMILEYVGPGKGPEAYQLWACRGEKKGCKKKQRNMKHCVDCFLPDEATTIGEVEKRINRGDA